MPKNCSLKLIFAGTPAFGIPALNALFSSRHHLEAVYTQPDKPVGRGKKIQFSPVKEWALSHDMPVIQPENFKSQVVVEQLKAFKPDVMVVIAYGLILPKAVLGIPRFGCINVHASLLPYLRGASPIQSAILQGYSETGVTIMQMDVGMDTGDILASASTPILPEDTTGSLHDKLSQMAVAPLLNVLDSLEEGKAISIPQIHTDATYTKKIEKEEAHLNWSKSAACLAREIRAYNPWPGSFTFCEALRIRVLQAIALDELCTEEPGIILSIEKNKIRVATGQGVLGITVLQFAGGRVMPVLEWYNAKKPALWAGQRLS